MSYFPLFVELEGCPALVVGGGRVALGKARRLRSFGARVRCVKRRFRPADLRGARLVVAATNDPAVNKQVSRLARRRGIPVNVVDQPALCSFVFPSVVRRGRLVLAVSTGGASPALAKWIRKDLQRRYGPEFGRSLARMARVRKQVMGGGVSPRRRKKIFEEALGAYLRVIKRGRVDLAPGRRA